MYFVAQKFGGFKKKSYLCARKGSELLKFEIMEQYHYSVEELRASVEEGTRQVEQGQYYTDAQVNWMLEHHNRQLA